MWAGYLMISIGAVFSVPLLIDGVKALLCKSSPQEQAIPRGQASASSSQPISKTSSRQDSPLSSDNYPSSDPLPKSPTPSKDSFKIEHFFDAKTLGRLPELNNGDVDTLLKCTKCKCPFHSLSRRPSVLKIFEEKKAPILKMDDKNGNLIVIMRFSIYSKGKRWVEDGMIKFYQSKQGEWRFYCYKVSKRVCGGFVLNLPCPVLSSNQKEWLEQLSKGKEIPLQAFGDNETSDDKTSFEPTQYQYTCKLWSLQEMKQRPPIEYIFGAGDYGKRDLPTFDSGDVFMYHQLAQAVLLYGQILQGVLKNREPYYLVSINNGLFFLWEDQGRWRIFVQDRLKLSSEYLDELKEEEIDCLEQIRRLRDNNGELFFFVPRRG